MESIFEFTDYKSVLSEFLASHEKSWGIKSKLATSLGIHSAHLSQVLSQQKHLTLEQVERLARFMGLDEFETEYLMTLHQENRAGTQELKSHFKRKMDRMIKDHRDISKRYGEKKALSEKDQVLYYAHWLYAALHMAIAIPGNNNPKVLAQYFRVSENKVHEVLQFLQATGLVKKTTTGFELTNLWVRLPRDSPVMTQHHYNLRYKALESVSRDSQEDLHYSGYYTFSNSDFAQIRELWYQTIRKMQEMVAPSPSEGLFAVSLDFFHV